MSGVLYGFAISSQRCCGRWLVGTSDISTFSSFAIVWEKGKLESGETLATDGGGEGRLREVRIHRVGPAKSNSCRNLCILSKYIARPLVRDF